MVTSKFSSIPGISHQSSLPLNVLRFWSNAEATYGSRRRIQPNLAATRGFYTKETAQYTRCTAERMQSAQYESGTAQRMPKKETKTSESLVRNAGFLGIALQGWFEIASELTCA
jgi:hypothetical protein